MYLLFFMLLYIIQQCLLANNEIIVVAPNNQQVLSHTAQSVPQKAFYLAILFANPLKFQT